MTKPPPFLSGTMWPVHPIPQPDELLSSYIVRIARAHRARPKAFWESVAGVSKLLDVDFEPTPDLITVLVESVGLPVQRVRQMTIGRLANLRLLRDEDSRLIAFCSECLKSKPPYYRRSWCVDFYTVCAHHKTRLRTMCGECGAWIRFERLSLDKIFTSCHKCGFDVCQTPTETFQMADSLPSVISHQDRLTRLLDTYSDSGDFRL